MHLLGGDAFLVVMHLRNHGFKAKARNHERKLHGQDSNTGRGQKINFYLRAR